MAKTKSDDLEFRSARRSDLDAVFHIETTANLRLDPDFDVQAPYPLAYTRKDFDTLFAKRQGWFFALVLEGPVIVGYTIWQAVPSSLLLHSFMVTKWIPGRGKVEPYAA